MMLNVDEDLLLKFSASRTLTKVIISYVAIGVPSSRVCAECQAEGQGYIYRDTCVDACPDGSYLHAYQDNGYACRECSAFYNY